MLQDYTERRQLRADIRALNKEERQRQQKAVDETLKKAAVMCVTLTGTLGHHLARLEFDLVVIDEAGQVKIMHFLRHTGRQFLADIGYQNVRRLESEQSIPSTEFCPLCRH